MANGMIDNAVSTLTAYSKWLSRNGNKYPRPGCLASGSDIVSAIKAVADGLKLVMQIDDLRLLVGLAKASAPMLGNRKSLGCIVRAERIIKKMEEKCRQDMESQQQTPQG